MARGWGYNHVARVAEGSAAVAIAVAVFGTKTTVEASITMGPAVACADDRDEGASSVSEALKPSSNMSMAPRSESSLDCMLPASVRELELVYHRMMLTIARSNTARDLRLLRYDSCTQGTVHSVYFGGL